MSGDIRESSEVMGGMGKSGQNSTSANGGCEIYFFTFLLQEAFLDYWVYISRIAEGERCFSATGKCPPGFVGCKIFPLSFWACFRISALECIKIK